MRAACLAFASGALPAIAAAHPLLAGLLARIGREFDPLELIAALVSAWAVWLTARRSMWSWPLGLISVLLYLVVFAQNKLYSDALLQGIYMLLVGYGWWRWRQRLDDGGRVIVAPLPRGALPRGLLAGALLSVLLGAWMHAYTDAALPWLDASLTAYSLVAQWWQDRRHLAAWWLWIVVDVIYIGEYLNKQLWITAVLYAVFVWLAVLGLRHWRRAQRDAPEVTP